MHRRMYVECTCLCLSPHPVHVQLCVYHAAFSVVFDRVQSQPVRHERQRQRDHRVCLTPAISHSRSAPSALLSSLFSLAHSASVPRHHHDCHRTTALWPRTTISDATGRTTCSKGTRSRPPSRTAWACTGRRTSTYSRPQPLRLPSSNTCERCVCASTMNVLWD